MGKEAFGNHIQMMPSFSPEVLFKKDLFSLYVKYFTRPICEDYISVWPSEIYNVL